MSMLIDKVISSELKNHTKLIGDKWYIAKPMQYHNKFIVRLKDAWKVLIKKGHVYHFKEEE